MKRLLAVFTGLSLGLMSGVAQAQSLDQVKTSLVQDIRAAQKRLSQREKQIAAASAKLAHQIASAEKKLGKLREKAALNRRLADDNTLGLSEIKQRLREWSHQDNYQKRLLLELAENLDADNAMLQSISEDPAKGMGLIRRELGALKEATLPQWQSEKVTFPGGEIQSSQVLKMGPIAVFMSADHSRAGLLSDQSKVDYSFSPHQAEQLAAMMVSGKGTLTFDPSLGKALAIEKRQDSVLEHITRGGVWVMPILAFALFAIVIALIKAWQLWRLPKLAPMLIEQIETLSRYPDRQEKLIGLREKLDGAQRALLDIAVNTTDRQVRDDKLLAYMLAFRQRLNGFIGAIAITAAISPLLGLLGTVSGMIETFNMMTLFGAGDPSVVSGGISKALITTELGLVVAIPALIMHALLNRSVNHYIGQLNQTAIHLSKMEAA